MKKLLALVVLAAIGYGVYHFVLRSPEKRACARLATLCGDKAPDNAKCESDLADLRKQATPEVVDKLDKCLASASSCAEGGGCVVGTGLNIAGDLFNQFLKGLGAATSR